MTRTCSVEARRLLKTDFKDLKKERSQQCRVACCRGQRSVCDSLWDICIYKTVVCACLSVCSQLIGRTRFPALHSEIDWRASVSERAKREQKRCWNRIRCLYYKDALQHAEGWRDVRLYFFVNSLPFVLPMEEVMKVHSLANTGRVRHRQCMHMAARRSKETAEQWQQGTWRLIALKRLPDGHETRRVWRAAFPKRQPEQVAARRERDERLYEETIVPGGQETKSERAANHRAGERVVSLEVEVSDFGVISPRTNFLRCRNSHLKSSPTGHCHTSDGAQTTRAFFFVEGTHVYWQATDEQFFFSKFNIMFI